MSDQWLLDGKWRQRAQLGRLRFRERSHIKRNAATVIVAAVFAPILVTP